MKSFRTNWLLIISFFTILSIFLLWGCHFKNPADDVVLRLNANINKSIFNGTLAGPSIIKTFISNLHVTSPENQLGKVAYNDTSFMEVDLGPVTRELIDRYKPLIHEEEGVADTTFIHVLRGSATNNKKCDVYFNMYYSDSSGILNPKVSADIHVFRLHFRPLETLTIDQDADFTKIVAIDSLNDYLEGLLDVPPPERLIAYFTADGDSVDMQMHEVYMNLGAWAHTRTTITPENYEKFELNELEEPGLSGLVINNGTEDVVVKVYLGTSGVPFDEPLDEEELIAQFTVEVSDTVDLSEYRELYLTEDGTETILACFENLTGTELAEGGEPPQTWFVDITAESSADITVKFFEVEFDGLAELEVDTD